MKQKNINKTQLIRLLTIQNPKKETIFSVVGRMKVLLEYFEAEPAFHTFVPFLKTYYYVTKNSAEKYIEKKHYFWSLRDHEVLDVYFATLYFKPMLTYLTTGKMLTPWEHYFSYCKDPKGIPFLQLMLGINTHINADLYSAIVTLRYRHEADFFLVNDILQEVTPEVMKYLVFSEHDVVGLAGSIWKEFAVNELHMIIERWRSEAWVHAMLTKSKNKKEMEDKIFRETEQLGGQLVKDLTSLYHLKDMKHARDSLEKLSVSIL